MLGVILFVLYAAVLAFPAFLWKSSKLGLVLTYGILGLVLVASGPGNHFEFAHPTIAIVAFILNVLFLIGVSIGVSMRGTKGRNIFFICLAGLVLLAIGGRL